MNAREILYSMLFVVVAFGFAFLFFALFDKDPAGIIETQSPLVPAGVYAPSLTFEGVTLNDSTVYDPETNTCTANANGMRVEIKPCVAMGFGGTATQFVNFSWHGAQPQSTGWIFVYEGELKRGRLDVYSESAPFTEQQTITRSQYVSGYMVRNVTTYSNLGTPDARCELGNTNNTQMYSVTHNNGGNETALTRVYCFTTINTINPTTFSISGNADITTNELVSGVRPGFVDVTNSVEYLGSGLLNDDRSYYRVRDVEFAPGQSIYTRWLYSSNSSVGKWHILGYDSSMNLESALLAGRYIYIDPVWYDGYGNTNGKYQYYRFNEGTGSNTLELVSNLNKTFSGAPTWIIPSNWGADYGNATLGSGTAELNTGHYTEGDEVFTIEMRVNTTFPNGNRYLFSSGASGAACDGTHKGLAFDWNAGSGEAFYSCNGASITQLLPDITANTIHHFAFVYNKTACKFYLDGVLTGGVWATCSGGTGNSSQPLTIFDRPVDSSSPGGTPIDQLIIWKRELTSAEVLSANASSGDGSEAQPSDGTTITMALVSPVDMYTTNNNTILLNATATVTGTYANLTNMTFYIWNNLTNAVYNTSTFMYSTPENRSQFWVAGNMAEGAYKWNVYGCAKNTTSSVCNFATSNRTLIYDITPPVVTILAPANLSTFLDFNTPINISINFTTSGTPLSCRITDGTTATTINCNLNTSVMAPAGTTTYTILGNDSANNTGLDRRTITVIDPFTNNSATYNATALETSSQSFTLNSTYNSSLISSISAVFYYNNTIYPTTKTDSDGDTFFTAALITPDVVANTNKNFYWTVTLLYGSTTYMFNSSTYTQQVQPLNASICKLGYTVPFLNFTIYDERNLTKIESKFDGTLDYGVTTLSQVLSYDSDTVDENNYTICLSPPSATFNARAYVEWDAATEYEQEGYYLIKTVLTNQTTDIGIYLLLDAFSTEYDLTVRDEAYEPIEGAVVHVERYYPGANVWRVVESVKTDVDGQTVAHLESINANYRFAVYINDALAYRTVPTVVSCQSLPCSVIITLPAQAAAGLLPFNELSDITYSLTWNATSHNVTYFYTDTDAEASGGRLRVVQIAGIGATSEVCDTSSAAIAGALTCSLVNVKNGTFVATAYITRGGTNYTIDSLTFGKSYDSVGVVGKSGLLFAGLLLIACVLFIPFKPVLSIVMALVALVALNLLGFVAIGGSATFALVFVAIFILWEVTR